MSYIKSTLIYRLRARISKSSKPEEACLRLYADADFAGDKVTSRSTSGAFLVLAGNGIFVPIGAASKKQTCVSHSTPEAELVAADFALRTQGIPGLEIAQALYGKKILLYFEEDNNTAITTINNGFSPAMRHIGRTHRVSLRWLHEVCQTPCVILRRCDTNDQAADIFTKAFTNAEQWSNVTSLLGVT